MVLNIVILVINDFTIVVSTLFDVCEADSKSYFRIEITLHKCLNVIREERKEKLDEGNDFSMGNYEGKIDVGNLIFIKLLVIERWKYMLVDAKLRQWYHLNINFIRSPFWKSFNNDFSECNLKCIIFHDTMRQITFSINTNDMMMLVCINFIHFDVSQLNNVQISYCASTVEFVWRQGRTYIINIRLFILGLKFEISYILFYNIKMAKYKIKNQMKITFDDYKERFLGWITLIQLQFTWYHQIVHSLIDNDSESDSMIERNLHYLALFIHQFNLDIRRCWFTWNDERFVLFGCYDLIYRFNQKFVWIWIIKNWCYN